MHSNRIVKAIPAIVAGLAMTSGTFADMKDGLEPRPELMPQIIESPSMFDEALRAFDLTNTSMAKLTVPLEAGAAFETVVPINGENLTLKVAPHSIRSEGYKLLVDIGDGVIEERQPGKIITYRGIVEGLEGAVVAGSLFEGEGFEARVLLADGTSYWIEPMTLKVGDAEFGDHVIYANDDAIGHGGTCEVIELPHDDGDGIAPRGGGCGGGTCVAQLGCDADFEFYTGRGSSVTNVENRINAVINSVNAQYESQVGITHEITAIIVRTTDGGGGYTSTNPNTLLNQFRNEWNNNQGGITRDVAELFSGKEFDGTTIGLASVGVICTSNGYNIVESDCCGSLSCSSDLSAHELGHNWSALHCSCPGNTMNPSLVCANSFTAGSINSITNHRDSRSCLSPLETGSTTLPFFDDFPAGPLDGSLWIGIEGANTSPAGLNPPSSPNSLRLNGQDQLRSALMDTTGATNVTLSYYWQRTGGANSPEPGDDLYVEYYSSTGLWSTVNVHLGDGPDMTDFQFESVVLPGNASHTDFRIRFRHTADDAFFDDFHVDDVMIVATEDPPGPFNLLTPTDGETDVDLGPLFDWEDAGGAANYRLKVDDDSDFSSPALNLVVIGSTANIGGNPLDNATLYYWTVEANNDNGTTLPTTPVFTFSTPGYVPPMDCDGDANGDNMVNFDDLNFVLGNWGTAGPDGDVFPTGGGDGNVNFDDLNFVLSNWGTSCP